MTSPPDRDRRCLCCRLAALSAALVVSTWVSTLTRPARAADQPAGARVAVVVGSNAAAPGRKALQYGHKDAASVVDALTSVGGFRPEDVHLLRDPSADDLLTALRAASTALSARPESLLYFYYSGHADDKSIYPAGRPVGFEEIRAVLEAARVSVRIGMIDACRGGSWTRAKGLVPADPFPVRWPLSLDTEGSVLIASSSGAESAHESDELQGSFFTHHFVVGMRGGADRNDNGEVTLTEAFEYAKERTIRDSLRGARETQHPSYAVNLRGRRDLVLAQIAAGPTTVELSQRRGPLELIHIESGVQLLELPVGERRVKLAVPPGQYLIRKQPEPGAILVKEVSVKPGETTFITEDQLSLVGSTRLSAKAASLPVEAFRTVPGRPLGPSTVFGKAPASVRPSTPDWVRFTSVGAFAVSAAALGLGIKFQLDVRHYDRLIDPLRRFPCNADDKTYGCDKNGQSAVPLRSQDLDYRQQLSDSGKDFQTKAFYAFGTAAVFAVAGGVLTYRWIRGEEPVHDAFAWILLPPAGGPAGLAAVGTF